jgi:hypothetical protein
MLPWDLTEGVLQDVMRAYHEETASATRGDGPTKTINTCKARVGKGDSAFEVATIYCISGSIDQVLGGAQGTRAHDRSNRDSSNRT